MNTKLLVALFYIISNFIVFTYVDFHQNYGIAVNFKEVDINTNLPLDFLLGVILPFVFLFPIHNLLCKIKIPIRLESANYAIDYIYILCLAINIVTLMSGIGIAGTTTKEFGFLQSIIPLIPCTMIYFAFTFNNIKRHQILLLITGTCLTLLKGWTSNLAILVILFILMRNKNGRIPLRKLPFLILLFAIFVTVYYYLYGLKYLIRIGEFQLIPVDEYLYYVFARVSHFPLYSYLNSIAEQFSIIINDNYSSLFYVQEYIFGFIPKSLFGFSEFRFLDNLYTIYFINPLLDSSGFSITFAGLVRLSAGMNDLYLSTIIFLLFSLLLFFYQILLLRLMGCNGYKSLTFLTMILLIQTGNLKEVALYNYTLTVIFLLTLIFKRFLKIKKNS
ncbi:oligosaccharide repeat unit polymerase [Providencia rettgeri]|uniref:oligosaccharide repeat unit polymerase n=1 Tax=Providencia rettgeri TaxID=587 RepID=UPI001BA59C2F|nr:oligosaccharide repeat unit polymerase [Providencia rettgeri]MBS0916724.1 oligosaccharide repeat unit polymerase [Providencia rettgeri]